MRRGYVVAVVEVGADANRDRLLAGIEMDETGNPSFREELGHSLLEGPDRGHALVDRDSVVTSQFHSQAPPVGEPNANDLP